jgi:hypothetical protein
MLKMLHVTLLETASERIAATKNLNSPIDGTNSLPCRFNASAFYQELGKRCSNCKLIGAFRQVGTGLES